MSSKPNLNLKPEPVSSYTLHDYDHKYDAALAQMWNESDDQWPGTFNEGVPLTEERLRDWMDNMTCLMRFVIAREGDGKIVGYGDLWEEVAIPGSCYVALLNVHPEHQGKSLARRMLQRMVDWATDNGYHRVSIETWSANLKAMPLYKKTGFFWMPDTMVFMENYIPAVRQLPAARAFFEKHNWYASYARELKQVEDDMRHPRTGDSKIFVLKWEADGDALEAVFDRNAQQLIGIATNDWAAYARVGNAEPVQGVSYPLEWEVINNGAAPLALTISVAGDEGIEVDHAQSLSVPPGQSKIITSTFRVAVDAPKRIDKPHAHLPTPMIRSTLTIDGQPLELANGLRYRPAVTFSTHPEVLSLLPGQPYPVLLQLENNVTAPLAGDILLDLPAGITADWGTHAFTADPKDFCGIPVTLTAERGGYYPIGASIRFEDAGETITTQKQLLPAIALAPGGWVAGEGDGELIVENDFFRLTCKHLSGAAKIWSKRIQYHEGEILEELGQPFVPQDLNEQRYDVRLEKTEDGAAKINMTVNSTRFPGMVVGREITMTGAPTLTVRNWVTNTSDQPIAELKIRPTVRMQLGQRYMVVPLDDKIVRERMREFGAADGDLPEQPEKYDAPWIAYEQPGSVLGVVWPADGLEKIMFRRGGNFFITPLGELAAGQTARTAPIYLYSGPGDWRVIQALENRLRSQPTGHPETALPVAERHLSFGFPHNALLTVDEEIKTSLHTRTTREYKVSGTLAVTPPPGWQISRPHTPFADVNNKTPMREDVVLQTTGSQMGATQGAVKIETPGFDRTQKFTLIKLGDRTPVKTTAGARAGVPLWTLHNGRTQWEIAPNFGGAVVSWRERDQETNHLMTSFPDGGELGWIKPWFGGIHPLLNDSTADEAWPGKLDTETFTASPIAAPADQNLPWAGLRLTAHVQARRFRGIRIEVDYVTLGDSNVLKVIYRTINESDIYRSKVEPGLFAFFQVDGEHKNAVLHARDLHRKRLPVATWVKAGPWAAVENPATGRAIATVFGNSFEQQLAMDWGNDGAHVHTHEIITLAPGATHEMVCYYALVGSVEEARLYEALKESEIER